MSSDSRVIETSVPEVDGGWLRRYQSYLAERFPLVGNGLLICSFYSANQFLAHALNEPGSAMRYDLTTLLGCLTILCFFLHLRIFDDHKDFAADCRSHPQRVLQRGIVSLRDLKLLAGCAIAIEVTCAAVCGLPALLAWACAFVFSLLMLKEFFVGEWLRDRFVLYASIHMMVIPLLALTIWSFSSTRFIWDVEPIFWVYVLTSYFLAFNWEVSRKIRMPSDEIVGVDSYTKRFGIRGAPILVQMLRVVSSVLVAIVAYALELSIWFYFAIALLFILCLFSFVEHLRRPSAKTSKHMEIYAGLYIVAFDLILAVELSRTYGIEIVGVL